MYVPYYFFLYVHCIKERCQELKEIESYRFDIDNEFDILVQCDQICDRSLQYRRVKSCAVFLFNARIAEDHAVDV